REPAIIPCVTPSLIRRQRSPGAAATNPRQRRQLLRQPPGPKPLHPLKLETLQPAPLRTIPFSKRQARLSGQRRRPKRLQSRIRAWFKRLPASARTILARRTRTFLDWRECPNTSPPPTKRRRWLRRRTRTRIGIRKPTDGHRGKIRAIRLIGRCPVRCRERPRRSFRRPRKASPSAWALRWPSREWKIRLSASPNKPSASARPINWRLVSYSCPA